MTAANRSKTLRGCPICGWDDLTGVAERCPTCGGGIRDRVPRPPRDRQFAKDPDATMWWVGTISLAVMGAPALLAGFVAGLLALSLLSTGDVFLGLLILFWTGFVVGCPAVLYLVWRRIGPWYVYRAGVVSRFLLYVMLWLWVPLAVFVAIFLVMGMRAAAVLGAFE